MQVKYRAKTLPNDTGRLDNGQILILLLILPG
jgi:hypothetical protein